MIPAFTRYRSASPGGDPYFSSVGILLHGEGANGGTVFTDSSSVAHTNIALTGNVVTSTAQAKFGASSLKFAGTQSGSGTNEAWLDVPGDASLSFGTGDFTIELWFYQNATGTSGYLIDCRPSGTNGGYATLMVESNAVNYVVNGSYVIVSTTNPAVGAWHHAAVVRQSGVTRMYLDGSAMGSPYSDATNYVANARLRIGASGAAGAYSLNGYIDELRVTKGVARYTGNFTPPTAAFPDHA
ncbi:LamG domain-containing protein [Ralstonia insidiosa]|uniref:LamG domain-containing protein n=1 Tax=Ralstonia insidiosa TaxID=190721 RepID=UPI00205AC310|nr:LamG domain-containing protein [Ralstonia insidiosa]MDE4924377.1 LamG domain-containing protein [Ralstonia insidiosa]UNJ99921.1 LamG domain-containing protein [Ralstonia insidiosa]